MRTHLLTLAFIVLAATDAAGQGSATARELFAGAGACRVGGDEGSRGTGPCFMGGVGVRLAQTAVEVEVLRARHERDIAGGPLEGTATGLFGNVVYHFSGGRTQVFVTGSAGLLRSRTNHIFPVGGTPTTFTSDDTDFAWGAGVGVKVFLTPQFSLRPQFRLIFSEATGVMGLASTSVGIGYHW